MKKYLLSIFAFCICALASAQDTDAFRAFVSNVTDARVSFTYSFTSGFQTKVTGKGTALVEGDSFYLNGNGMEIYCDGKSATTIDRVAKEVIVESLEEDQGNYVNPSILISSIDKSFKCKSQTKVSYAGHQAVKVILEPKRDLGVARITLYLSGVGNILYGATLSQEDGSSTDFFIPSFKILPKGPQSDFKLDLKSLDKGYIITDLR